MTLLSRIIAVVTIAAALVGCGQSIGQPPTQTRPLTFTYAMSGLYKPFNFTTENGKLSGFDVEIGEALAKDMGMNPAPVTNPWETIIQGLLNNKYDAIIGSMAITPEREKVVSFTKPYYRSGAQIFVSEENNVIHSAADLNGKKIGVVKSSTYKQLALQYTPADHVNSYDSDLTALMDLPTGRLDAVITDQMVGFQAMKNGLKIKPVGKPLTMDKMGIAVRKDDTELLNKLNKALDDIINDGTYQEISDKWFGRSILGDNQ